VQPGKENMHNRRKEKICCNSSEETKQLLIGIESRCNQGKKIFLTGEKREYFKKHLKQHLL